ncbi:MAG: acetate/propionate family kinase, partial [Burkholderiales bacterium]|nr:acetate/propionate family kinase [Burkholderiales bacterium]
ATLRFKARFADGRPEVSVDGGLPGASSDRVPHHASEALDGLWRWVEAQLQGRRLVGVGHRVVHGGTAFSAPVRVDRPTLAALQQLGSLAPLHQPHNLGPIDRLLTEQPALPQVACFDTAFHRTQPVVAELFALPRQFYDEGIRRYGFHGLSYEFVATRLRDCAPQAFAGRTVVAHLGNGVSMCALHAGRSVASTMGFTALDGCPMGTRTGSLDPGVVLHLARERGMSLDAIEDLLYKRSGLLGLSGVSHDMRALESSEAPGAALAIEYFVYRLAREVGSLAVAMGGLDALVFTAGIGENSPRIRAAVCERLAWLGLTLDANANAGAQVAAGSGAAVRISASDSRLEAWRVPTDEELVIARHTLDLLGRSSPKHSG